MTLAIFIVIASALALVLILWLIAPQLRPLSPGRGLIGQIQPLDIEAFRNLVDPGEREYLRQRLPAAEFRTVQRKRLLAMAAYVQLAGRNAVLLNRIGHAALNSASPQTVEAARQLIDNALLLQRKASFALLWIYCAWVWPESNMAAIPILHGYEKLNGSAMLLGRLQNPAAPVRISAL